MTEGGIILPGDYRFLSPEQINTLHAKSDVDKGINSQHHTLGGNPNQAAPGNHVHESLYETIYSAQHGVAAYTPAAGWSSIANFNYRKRKKSTKLVIMLTNTAYSSAIGLVQYGVRTTAAGPITKIGHFFYNQTSVHLLGAGAGELTEESVGINQCVITIQPFAGNVNVDTNDYITVSIRETLGP